MLLLFFASCVYQWQTPWIASTWQPWTSQCDEEHLKTPLSILAARRGSQWGNKVNIPEVVRPEWGPDPWAGLGGISENGQSWPACYGIFSLEMLTSVDQQSPNLDTSYFWLLPQPSGRDCRMYSTDTSESGKWISTDCTSDRERFSLFQFPVTAHL